METTFSYNSEKGIERLLLRDVLFTRDEKCDYGQLFTFITCISTSQAHTQQWSYTAEGLLHLGLLTHSSYSLGFITHQDSHLSLTSTILCTPILCGSMGTNALNIPPPPRVLFSRHPFT